MPEFLSGSSASAKRLYHLPGKNRIMFRYHGATAEHWDSHWRMYPASGAPRADCWECRVTARYLPRGAQIVEGGCGLGSKVAALQLAGYKVEGIDFAAETVVRANGTHPGVAIRQGDVRATGMRAESLDGYWSLGVVEHFPEGPHEILKEAARILRPGGYLFLTAPWFSPLRRQLVSSGRIPVWTGQELPSDFYQYAFSREEVHRELAQVGFEVKAWHARSALKGLSDEIAWTRPVLRAVHASPRPVGALATRLIECAFASKVGHGFLVVARKMRS